MWRYRFNMQRPVNQDVTVLVLTRYDDGDNSNLFGNVFHTVRQEVLTNHGWRAFQEWDMLTDLPAISGHDTVTQRSTERVLSEWETRIRESINAPS